MCLGKLAFDTYLSIVGKSRAAYKFEHNAVHELDPLVISSYHPSQQNTSTKRLTREMLHDVFSTARSLLKD